MSATSVGKFWAVTSFLAAIATAIGYYFPYWIQGYVAYDGEKFPMYFGVFRRCSYPELNIDNTMEIIDGCGRYSTFVDIPSIWWKISTITIGSGVGLALLISLIGLIALCVRDIITTKIARLLGLVQMSAGLLVGGGVAIYPNGWSSTEVRQSCGGRSGPYELGKCELCWAFFMTSVGGTLTLLCSALTCYSFDDKHQYRSVIATHV
ncbi:lipoma hmgic fusion partner-like protein [Plakobranchus ocellatus]|uniref:Lipoma hmgic fusion partner-like protein n=1 Tax=Plakobranchus ocellatus TaxID=259542 RepID=A0AAV3YXV3_9GAST|nr:lipoma hmgic fusion partner-like protein [Plakobranchus ocellatus]